MTGFLPTMSRFGCPCRLYLDMFQTKIAEVERRLVRFQSLQHRNERLRKAPIQAFTQCLSTEQPHQSIHLARNSGPFIFKL